MQMNYSIFIKNKYIFRYVHMMSIREICHNPLQTRTIVIAKINFYVSKGELYVVYQN